MIQVLIVDDHKLVRDGLQALLGREKDIRVVGEARDGVEAVQLIASLAPDVVLLDMEMPRLGGLGVLKQMEASGCPARILVVSMITDESIVASAWEHGARGYISKNSEFGELTRAIRSVYSGTRYFPAHLVDAASEQRRT